MKTFPPSTFEGYKLAAHAKMQQDQQICRQSRGAEDAKIRESRAQTLKKWAEEDQARAQKRKVEDEDLARKCDEDNLAWYWFVSPPGTAENSNAMSSTPAAGFSGHGSESSLGSQYPSEQELPTISQEPAMQQPSASPQDPSHSSGHSRKGKEKASSGSSMPENRASFTPGERQSVDSGKQGKELSPGLKTTSTKDLKGDECIIQVHQYLGLPNYYVVNCHYCLSPSAKGPILGSLENLKSHLLEKHQISTLSEDSMKTVLHDCGTLIIDATDEWWESFKAQKLSATDCGPQSQSTHTASQVNCKIADVVPGDVVIKLPSKFKTGQAVKPGFYTLACKMCNRKIPGYAHPMRFYTEHLNSVHHKKGEPRYVAYTTFRNCATYIIDATDAWFKSHCSKIGFAKSLAGTCLRRSSVVVDPDEANGKRFVSPEIPSRQEPGEKRIKEEGSDREDLYKAKSPPPKRRRTKRYTSADRINNHATRPKTNFGPSISSDNESYSAADKERSNEGAKETFTHKGLYTHTSPTKQKGPDTDRRARMQRRGSTKLESWGPGPEESSNEGMTRAGGGN
ncbi:hypothetical protein BP6252_00602 [Coleophoma cylindrospora]|uniref:Uncharacterized protein n=1 Tax=Coleophoma cylindrospora TaxID=1849047 RepID=A0A3D8SQH5_9HELO|nr:hypothetical protein BP6252_00602 [Coleophoma cylindrospora]